MSTQETYRVIALRWRPQSFDEVVGQEVIVRTLKNSIEHKRIAHAYLFIGPGGTGKTSMARILAMSLNATDGPSVNPSPEDPIVQQIAQGRSLDVIEIDGASNNGVEQIRQICAECQYRPTQCRYKIYIIDEVHMLSSAAFNSLLKTLEEPPEHVIFIFATTDVDKVLPTIKSRCQRFEFHPIEQTKLVARLKQIANDEAVSVSDETLRDIGRLSRGGMRDAQSILEQLIAFCGQTIEHEAFLSIHGMISQAQSEALVADLIQKDYLAVNQKIDAFIESGKDVAYILDRIKDHFQAELVESLKSRQAPLTQQLIRALDLIAEGELQLKSGFSKNLVFKLILLKLIHAFDQKDINSLIEELVAIKVVSTQGSAQKKTT